MAERSVSNIRAMFEARHDKESSPPSRGRSPAGSERSGAGSRNVSNIRSSFVAVEKSGQMGPMVGLRRVSDAAGGSPSAAERLIPADGISPLQRGRNPLSRTSSLTGVQEENGGLGTILKGSPFEDPTKQTGKSLADIPRSEPKPVQAQPPEPKQTESQVTPLQKVADKAAASVSKIKATLPKRNENAAPAQPAPISTKQPAAKEKQTAGSARTPTSATRAGPALKVSSPKTATAPNGSTQKAAQKLSTKPSRASLAGASSARAKSPAKVVSTANKPPRQSDIGLRTKPSRPSMAASSPEFLNRMMRPTASSSSKLNTEDKSKEVEKAPKQTAGRAPDSGFLERMMRPTAASANKHDEEQPAASKTAAKPTKAPADPSFLERMMRPTQASSQKHEKEEKTQEPKKTRSSLGGKSADSGFLERMMRPTASSSSKTHAASEEQLVPHVSPPRASTAKVPVGTTAVKPVQKTDGLKESVKSNTNVKPKSSASDPVAPDTTSTPVVNPEAGDGKVVDGTQEKVAAVETEKLEKAPEVSSGNVSVKAASEAANPPSEKPEQIQIESPTKAQLEKERLAALDTPAKEEPESLAAEPKQSATAATVALESQDTQLEPSSANEQGAAGSAPAPVMAEGKKIVEEARKEAAEAQEKREDGDKTVPNAAEAISTLI